MASLYKKPITLTDRKTGERVKTKSKKWWGRFRDENGQEKRVPLASDKAAAQAMLNEIVQKIERVKAGLVDPTDAERKRPLGEHMNEFRNFLKNKGVTSKQVHESTTQLKKIVDAQKWKRIGDISASGVLDYLGELRRAGKSVQTYNHYLKSAKQFTRWLMRDRRTSLDPLAYLAKQNVSTDRRHDRRALGTDEFTRLVEAARVGKKIETVSGPDRAMMYVLAGWTGFRKGEIGSLALRSFRLDDEPPTATVAACYSKRKRQDTQILHPEVVRRLQEWLKTKSDLGRDDLLFPISGRVPGGTERKTHKMMQLDLRAARNHWIEEAQDQPAEKTRREKSDFLAYKSDDGLFADFHSNRHMFITSLERAGLSPKMAQTLARHSDVRLTLGIYTHVGLHDQTSAIESLPAPRTFDESGSKAAMLRATGTEGRLNEAKETGRVVPTVVPSGAENGAVRLASGTNDLAPNCTREAGEGEETADSQIVVNPNGPRTIRTARDHSASRCTAVGRPNEQVSPARLELATFGFGVQLLRFSQSGRL